MQYNHISDPGTTTQACGDSTYQRMHTQSEWEIALFLCDVENNFLEWEHGEHQPLHDGFTYRYYS